MATPPAPDPEQVPLTSSRAVRLALTRAADKTLNMVVSVLGLREETLNLDDLLESLDPAHMLVALERDGQMVGLAAVDLQLRAATIEAQTVGQVLATAPDERAPTGTDAEMLAPLLRAFMIHLEGTAPGTPLDGWMTGVSVGSRVSSARAAGLVLPQDSYRTVRLTVDLCVGDRQAELLLTLPGVSQIVPKLPPLPEEDADWNTRFKAMVNDSPVTLDAVLHAFKMPLFEAEALHVGQVVPLPGCTVGSVRLISPDGRKMLTARLGQSAGMRAVRLEAPEGAQISDITGLGGAMGLPVPDTGFGMDDGMGMMGGDDAPMAFEMDADQMPSDDVPAMMFDEPVAQADAADMDFGFGGDAPEGSFAAEMAMDDQEVPDADMPAMAPMADLDWSDEDLPQA